jgi:2'-5' RNA ligase
MEQRPLPGIGHAAAGGTHNLFFALQPNEDVRTAIAAESGRLAHERAPRGRWIKPHRYHLTLQFLGTHARLPDALVGAALAAGERVRVPAFEFTLDRAGSFASRSTPWWLGCSRIAEGLAALHASIATELRGEDCRIRHEEDFAAHVTILRGSDRALPPVPIAPIEWPVDGFVLIDSRLGVESRHEVLRRWPLSA